MGSLILSTATRYLLALLFLFSIFLLLRGHNSPGGGFVGGLVASTAFMLYAFASDVEQARKVLRIEPRIFIGVGLLTAVGSGLISVFINSPFMTGLWYPNTVPVFGKLGTPVIFDIGVYLVVLGVTLTILFSLLERE